MNAANTIGLALRAIRPNLDQGLSLSRSSIAGVGWSLIWAGLPIGNWPLTGAGVLVVLGTVVWGIMSRTDAAKLKAVEAMPDVKAIVVKPTATNGVAEAAADPTRPKIKAA